MGRAPTLCVAPVTYTITVVNNGPSAATEVTLVDTLPASTIPSVTPGLPSAAPSQGSCSRSEGSVTVSCNLGSLNVGGSATVVIAVQAKALDSQFENGLLAFTSDRDAPTGNVEIYSMQSNGALQTRLTTNAAADQAPDWSPPGGTITNTATATASEGDPLVGNETASSTTQITQGLVFNSNRDGNAELYVMGNDGSVQTRLTTNSVTDAQAAWSHDGTRVAYTSFQGKNGFIRILNLATGDSAPVGALSCSAGSTRGCYPTWSPSDNELAFQTNQFGGSDFEIGRMNVDGTGALQLTNNDTSDYGPDWGTTPLGQQIVFESSRKPHAGQFEIYMMTASGNGPTRLTDSATDDVQPSLSPNGLEIAFGSRRDRNAEIYTMNYDGTGQTRLTVNRREESAPDWQPRVASP